MGVLSTANVYRGVSSRGMLSRGVCLALYLTRSFQQRHANQIATLC
jgi:hypothetical protein